MHDRIAAVLSHGFSACSSRERQTARFAVAASLVSALLFAAGCGSSSPPASTGADSPPASTGADSERTTAAAKGPLDNLTWNSPYGEPPSLDYIQAAYYPGVTIVTNVCDQLFKTDQRTGEVRPSLATDVRQESPTRLVYTIRQDVKFWDGTTLGPKDVVASLTRSMSDPKSGEGAFFRNVESIEQTGADEVTITFSAPDPMFRWEMENAVMGTIASADYMEAKGDAFGTPTGGIMCSGPYKVAKWSPGNEIVLAVNPDYWDKTVKPLAETVTFKFVTNSPSLVNALLSGAIDGSFEVPPAAISLLQDSDQGTLTFGPSTQEWIIIPISGPLKDARVRRAWSLAIDRAAILKTAFAGQGNVVTTFAPPTTWGYGEAVFQAAASEIPGASPDLATAKELVAEAGSAAKAPIVLAIQGDSQVQQQIGTAVQAAARNIGLNVQLRAVTAEAISNAELNASAREGIDALLFANYFNIADPLDEVFFFVGSDKELAYLNLLGYENATVNGLLDQAAQEPYGDKRATLYMQAEAQWIGKDQAFIPLVNPAAIAYGSKRITGWPTVFPYYSYPWAGYVGAP
ncbi:MAG: ABC transporter substrate-binding protein [Gemmatimonadota bacterium]